jgi:hypothetical protein
MSGQLTMANARFAGFGQHLVNFRDRERFGDDAKADEIRGPPPRAKRRRRPRHQAMLHDSKGLRLRDHS